MTQDWLILAVAIAVFYALLLSVRLRREGIRHKLRRLLLLGATYIAVIAYLRASGWTEGQAVLAGVIAALLVNGLIRTRSRYIPQSEKRKAIRRFESETGHKFDPRIHEIHHEIPFSKGGSNTADNLRVLTRRENRARGAKSPWWDLLGR